MPLSGPPNGQSCWAVLNMSEKRRRRRRRWQGREHPGVVLGRSIPRCGGKIKMDESSGR